MFPFLKKFPTLSKILFRGKKERKEKIFWETTSDPLPNPILSSLTLVFEKQAQKHNVQDMENEENPSQTLQHR